MAAPGAVLDIAERARRLEAELQALRMIVLAASPNPLIRHYVRQGCNNALGHARALTRALGLPVRRPRGLKRQLEGLGGGK